MKGLAHAKAAMLAARTKGELRQTTTDFCFAGRFSVSDDLSYSENAYIATRQNKNSVAELLRYADEIEVRLVTALKLLAELEISNKRIDEIINAVVAERDTLKQQNAELAAQVEAMKNGIHHFNRTRGDLNPLFKAAFDSTPAQCLLEVKAEAGRAGYEACLQNIGYHEPEWQDDAKAYAESLKQGGE